MAKDLCSVVVDENDFAEAAHSAGYESEVRAAVAGFMGEDIVMEERLRDDPKAWQKWQSLRDNLVEMLVENGRILSYDLYDPQSQLTALRNHLEATHNVSAQGRHAWVNANAKSIISMASRLNKLIHLQRSRFGKKLNIWERAFLPVSAFAIRADRFGLLPAFGDMAMSRVEDSRSMTSRFKDRISKAQTTYANTLDAILRDTQKAFYGPEYVLDGIDGIFVKDLGPVVFLGSEQDAEGNIVHNVLVEKNGERQQIPEEAINKVSLRNAIVNKWTHQFMNEVMDGERRQILWSPGSLRDALVKTPPDSPERRRAERAQKYISDAFDTLKKRSKAVEKGQLTKDEQRLGVPEIHFTKLPDGTKIEYVLVKRDQASEFTSELYDGYIISVENASGQKLHEIFGDGPKMSLKQLNADYGNLFRDGWYKAAEHKKYGQALNKYNKRADFRLQGWSFNNIGSNYMEYQPPNDVLNGQVRGQKSMSFASYVSELRRVLNDVYDDLRELADQENRLMTKAYNEFKNRVGGTPDAQRTLSKVRQVLGLHSQLWLHEDPETGFVDVVTPNSFLKFQKDNFFPRIYREEAILNQLERAIDELEARLANDKLPENIREKDQESLEKLRSAYERAHNYEGFKANLVQELERLPEEGDDIITSVLGTRAAHTKHRSAWTDPATRRKDSLVIQEYLDNTYMNISKNRLMAEMLRLSAIFHKSDPSVIDWLVNRTMVAFYDPDHSAGIGNVDYGFATMARWLNKLPGGRQFTAAGVQKFVQSTKGFFAALLLGSSSAMKNRTQTANVFIRYGAQATWDTFKILEGTDNRFPKEKVDAIIDFVGVDEITNMFVDMMAHGGDLGMQDAGILDIPGVPFKIPTFAAKDFVQMLVQNRKGFIENGLPKLEGVFENLSERRRENITAELGDIGQQRARVEAELESQATPAQRLRVQSVLKTLDREEKRLTSALERNNVRDLRAMFLDILTSGRDEQKEEIMRKKFQDLFGKVSENRLKRMVSWKLSWWFNGFGKELFTFTEGERYMRRHAAMVALKAAADSGVLGGKYEPSRGLEQDPAEMATLDYVDPDTGMGVPVSVPNVFLSNDAIRIARSAVNATMFGMSIPHLGEAFMGAGQQLFLYKAYPLQQMLHDWNITRRFFEGSNSVSDSMKRIVKGLHDFYKQTRYRTEYDPRASNIDHDAIAMARFMGTRVAMSALMIATELTVIGRYLLHSTPTSRQFASIIRGGENPAVGATMRLLANLIIYSAMDEDDLKMDELNWDLVRLFFPVFLTLPLNSLWEALEDE